MKTLVFFVLGYFLSLNLLSQNKELPRNVVALEIGKTGLIYNLVFDNRLKGSLYGFRLGLGSNFGKYIWAFTAQLGMYRLFGNKNRFFEAGIDIHYMDIREDSEDQFNVSSFVFPNKTTTTYFISINSGYRVYFRKSVFRIGVAPGFTKDEFIPGGYISFGFGF